MSKFPDYYVSRTLLGGEPDCNKRTIYNKNGDEICHFEASYRGWTKEQQRLLNVVLQALLNDLANMSVKNEKV